MPINAKKQFHMKLQGDSNVIAQSELTSKVKSASSQHELIHLNTLKNRYSKVSCATTMQNVFAQVMHFAMFSHSIPNRQ